MTSMRRKDVASTSFRRHVPTRFLINQCHIITILILKSDIIENSRIELREIVLPVPSNQIKVTFIIILPFNLVHLWFFPVSHRNWRKRWVDYWGGQRVCWPPLPNYWGACPPPPSSYAYVLHFQWTCICKVMSLFRKLKHNHTIYLKTYELGLWYLKSSSGLRGGLPDYILKSDEFWWIYPIVSFQMPR